MPEDKVCAVCGRSITWRAAWADDWAAVRYCSRSCRGRGIRPVDRALETEIRALLATRAAGATICPSEAARAVSGAPNDEQAWRPLMELARAAARRLVAAGEVQITQRGQVVDPSHAKGPIRVRLTRRG